MCHAEEFEVSSEGCKAPLKKLRKADNPLLLFCKDSCGSRMEEGLQKDERARAVVRLEPGKVAEIIGLVPDLIGKF